MKQINQARMLEPSINPIYLNYTLGLQIIPFKNVF